MTGSLLPISSLPGVSALAVGLAEGDGRVAAFLPDAPRLDVIRDRAAAVRAAFRPRTRADASLARVASGERAAVMTGQQVGLFTGPLLTVVKAMAACQLAAELDAGGAPASPVFWCASEDHDLVEVTRFPLPGAAGPVDAGPDAAPLAGNRRPVGALRLAEAGLDTDALLAKASEGAGSLRDEDAYRALSERSAGRTFLEAFRDTLGWILEGRGLLFADAARREDKPDVVPLAVRVVRERACVRELLAERAAQLSAAGHPLQVTADRHALPLFAIVEGERRLLHEEDGRFTLKGDEASWTEADVVARYESGEWLPSFSALTRPLVASALYPVAATVLGPAEIAYWAQAYPLFAWAGILPPVIVPRPMVALVDPAARRQMEKLELEVADVLKGADAILGARGARRSADVLSRVEAARAAALAALAELKPRLVEVDASLEKAVATTAEKVDFALAKLAERAAAASGRAEEALVSRVERLVAAVAPEGRLAERVYTPVTVLLRAGRAALVDALEQNVRWDRPGAVVVEP